MPAGAAQRAQQSELRLTFPGIQPTVQCDAGRAGKRQGQEHDHQQATPTRVGQRLLAAQGRLLFRDERFACGQAQFLHAENRRLAFCHCMIQVADGDVTVQPDLAGAAEDAAAVPVGVFNEIAKVGDDERLLPGVHRWEKLGDPFDLDGQCERGHAEADLLADFGSGGIQDARADDGPHGRSVLTRPQTRRANAAGRPAENGGTSGPRTGYVAAGFHRVKSGTHVVFDDAPAICGVQAGDHHLTGVGVRRQPIDEEHAGAVSAGSTRDLQVDQGVRRNVEPGGVGVTGGPAATSEAKFGGSLQHLPLAGLADIAQWHVVISAGAVAKPGGDAHQGLTGKRPGLGGHRP